VQTQDALVGNIPTEILIAELNALGAQMPELQRLDELLSANVVIANAFA
jgi:hydroxymethylglutaryl-CoA lyase